MTLHFVAAHGSSVDSANALVIYEPRIEAGPAPDEVEYQYAIYQNEITRDGLGLFGLNMLIDEDGVRVRVFTLDLGQPQVLESTLKLKQRLGIEGDDFDFIHGLAEGLVRVFEGRTDNRETIRYMALTQDVALQAMGVVVPGGLPRLPDGQIVLAETDLI